MKRREFLQAGVATGVALASASALGDVFGRSSTESSLKLGGSPMAWHRSFLDMPDHAFAYGSPSGEPFWAICRGAAEHALTGGRSLLVLDSRLRTRRAIQLLFLNFVSSRSPGVTPCDRIGGSSGSACFSCGDRGIGRIDIAISPFDIAASRDKQYGYVGVDTLWPVGTFVDQPEWGRRPRSTDHPLWANRSVAMHLHRPGRHVFLEGTAEPALAEFARRGAKLRMSSYIGNWMFPNLEKHEVDLHGIYCKSIGLSHPPTTQSGGVSVASFSL